MALRGVGHLVLAEERGRLRTKNIGMKLRCIQYQCATTYVIKAGRAIGKFAPCQAA